MSAPPPSASSSSQSAAWRPDSSTPVDPIRHDGAAMNDAPQKTAIVTGAAAGIGRATVVRLVTDGWRVVGLDRTDASFDGAELVVGDAGDSSGLATALDRCDGR